MFFVLLAVPIIEILAAAAVAHLIGWGWTILALVALSLFGVWQLKVQGLGAWRSAVIELGEGGSPAAAVIGGALRVVGAMMIVLPGFVTAAIGLVLLVNPIRGRLSDRAGRWMLVRFRLPGNLYRNGQAAAGAYRRGGGDDVVDVEGWEEPYRSPADFDRNVLGRPSS